MSQAKQALMDRLEVARPSLSEAILIDQSLTDKSHNQRASLLRNGLMVVLFTALEDFLRNRTAELLVELSKTVVPFNALPQDLQHASTMEAMRAVYAQAQIVKRGGDDPLPMIQQAALEVASTGSTTLAFNKYSFGYKSSNLTSSEIGEILKTLNLADAWNEMTRIASRCGFGSIPLRSQFEIAAQLRHKAAHSIRANVQPRDLESFCDSALAIASSFDILASRAVRLLKVGDPVVLTQRAALASTIRLRFVDHRSSGFAEVAEGVTRAQKVSAAKDEAMKAALARALIRNEPVVERNSSGKLLNWRVTEF
jgi:hypothetical protein